MKAMILAAGFGTRLLPYTKVLPKPMFTLDNRPLLEIHIQNLVRAGCRHIIINTHHLHDKINDFLENSRFDCELTVLHEPRILDTGGAIRNARQYLDRSDFFVVNADVVCSVDLTKVWNAHRQSRALATLALYDCEQFNKVGFDANRYITGFDGKNNALTFTGIQVLSPAIFDHFPDKKVFSSIDVYKTLSDSRKVKAYIPDRAFWSDIGTPEAYRKTSALSLCRQYFNISEDEQQNIELNRLAGDGSDRQWYRAVYENRSVIVSDHGICPDGSEQEKQLNAFVKIGRHLEASEVQVPQIISWDRLSGIVLVQDLNDRHLFNVVHKESDPLKRRQIYKKVIDGLIRFSNEGFKDFNPAWTCQTCSYDPQTILKFECRYFMEAFVNGYLGLKNRFEDYLFEFEYIAEKASSGGHTGLMHRDFQSRNIMIYQDKVYFIDFQSARTGPLAYDLASLLIDPYIMLMSDDQQYLFDYALEKLDLATVERNTFAQCFNHCRVTRNLQFLGAFSFLSQVKNKKQFERYIPDAVNLLDNSIKKLDTSKLPKLSALIRDIKGEELWKK